MENFNFDDVEYLTNYIKDGRYIILHDCDTDLYVYTNAPELDIHDAIVERNRVLELDLPFSSDFEIIQEVLQDKGYFFEEVHSNEYYNW